MRKMGFGERWIGLIMVCVRTITYSILVNREPKGLICPTKGIRQGDPLSPFLFILCSKGLHGLIKQAAREGEIRGFSLCKWGPKLTYLFSTNDILLFCKENSEECGNILRLLTTYEKSYCQKKKKKQQSILANTLRKLLGKVSKELLGFKK